MECLAFTYFFKNNSLLLRCEGIGLFLVKHVDGLEHFHFHLLRHTFTCNLLASGAPPKDVQELLGHSAVSTTMNIYAHATREAKRNSVRLLDKVAGND